MYAISINFTRHVEHTQVTGIFGSMLEDNFIETCEETQGSRGLVQKYLQNPSCLCTIQ